MNVSYKIINGYSDNRFRPEKLARRDEAAAFIYRMLDANSKIPVEPADPADPEGKNSFKVASINNGQLFTINRYYQTYDQANANVTNANNQVILYGDKVVKMASGVVVGNTPSNGNTVIYKEDMKTQLTYVSNLFQTEMKYISSDEFKVKVQVADTIGYVKHEAVELIPTALQTGQSYYYVENGDLKHEIYFPITQTSQSPYTVGFAPNFMVEGQQYYSWNGHTYLNSQGQTVGEAYPFFNNVSVRSMSSYTAADLDKYIMDKYPTGVLVGLGKAFKDAEDKYGLNALFMLSHAILETGGGSSAIAKDKKNLFGMGATDGNAYENATKYDTYEASIEDYAKNSLLPKYVDPNGRYANGAVYGNKSVGFNIKYASDINWGQKTGGRAYTMDQYLGGKDLKLTNYRLGETKDSSIEAEGLNIRSGPTTNDPVQYEIFKTGYPVTIVDEIQQPDGVWYKIFSDKTGEKFAYVHSAYIKILPAAK